MSLSGIPSAPWTLFERTAGLKNTRCCPKCSSREIACFPGWGGHYGSGNYVLVGRWLIWPLTAKVARYVCTQCGFAEEWVDTDEELCKVREHFQKSQTMFSTEFAHRGPGLASPPAG
jgi:hypothetical protein